MEQNANTKAQVRATVIGTAAAIAVYLLLLALLSAAAVRGWPEEETIPAVIPAAAALAAFAGLLGTARRAGALCAAIGAALFWSIVQFGGFLLSGSVEPKRSLALLLGAFLGAFAAAACAGKGKKRGRKKRAHRARR